MGSRALEDSNSWIKVTLGANGIWLLTAPTYDFRNILKYFILEEETLSFLLHPKFLFCDLRM